MALTSRVCFAFSVLEPSGFRMIVSLQWLCKSLLKFNLCWNWYAFVEFFPRNPFWPYWYLFFFFFLAIAGGFPSFLSGLPCWISTLYARFVQLFISTQETLLLLDLVFSRQVLLIGILNTVLQSFFVWSPGNLQYWYFCLLISTPSTRDIYIMLSRLFWDGGILLRFLR